MSEAHKNYGITDNVKPPPENPVTIQDATVALTDEFKNNEFVRQAIQMMG
jgi:hypothetical protein